MVSRGRGEGELRRCAYLERQPPPLVAGDGEGSEHAALQSATLSTFAAGHRLRAGPRLHDLLFDRDSSRSVTTASAVRQGRLMTVSSVRSIRIRSSAAHLTLLPDIHYSKE